MTNMIKSLKQIAEEMDVPKSNLTRWFRGETNPNVYYVEKLAEVVGCKIQIID